MAVIVFCYALGDNFKTNVHYKELFTMAHACLKNLTCAYGWEILFLLSPALLLKETVCYECIYVLQYQGELWGVVIRG